MNNDLKFLKEILNEQEFVCLNHAFLNMSKMHVDEDNIEIIKKEAPCEFYNDSDISCQSFYKYGSLIVKGEQK